MKGPLPASLIAATKRLCGAVNEVHARRHLSETQPPEYEETDMRLTKVSVDAAMAAYIGVQKRGSETEHATLMRLMDEGDPTLSALYEESLTAPDPHRGTDLQKLHDHRAALQADITERAQEYMKTENPRRLSQRKRPLKISEAVAEVVGNDPALYEHWGGFPV